MGGDAIIVDLESTVGPADKGRARNIMATPTNNPDVVLVGAGIMSATLAVMLKELDPSLKIEIYEVLGSEAQESSNAWNNAGTGHAALCELNYTPEKSDGRHRHFKGSRRQCRKVRCLNFCRRTPPQQRDLHQTLVRLTTRRSGDIAPDKKGVQNLNFLYMLLQRRWLAAAHPPPRRGAG